MTTSIYKLDNYYLKNGVFHLRSKYTNPFRYFLIAVFVMFSFTYLEGDGTSYANVPTSEGTWFYPVEESALHSYVGKFVKDPTESNAIANNIIKFSTKFSVDPKLVTAVVQTESVFDKHAISDAGAFGLMQVLPKWHLAKIKRAKETIGTPELFNIETNIYLGAWVLKDCLTQFPDTAKALRCYNGSVGQKTDYDAKVLSAYKGIQEFAKSPIDKT